MFQTARSGAMAEYAEIDETFAPVALQSIGEWINARFAKVESTTAPIASNGLFPAAKR